MNFTPMKGQSLVEVVFEEQESATGIIISTKKPKQSMFGKIVKINSTNEKLVEGDLILFSKFGNQPISLNKEYLIVPTNNILGKLVY